VPTKEEPIKAVAENGSDRMIPVISLVGRKNSGKTTFISSLIPLLEARGFRVACVKQHKHDVPVDIVGKDSWLYSQAGASCSIMSTSKQLSLVHQREQMADLEELSCIAAQSGCNILLAESFNSSPCIRGVERYVIARKERLEEPRFSPEQCSGIISDDPVLAEQWRQAGSLVFELNEVESFANFLCEEYGTY